MRYGLKNIIIENINNIFSQYPQIEKAVLYGSRAKGNYKTGSDIDLVLYGNKLTLSLVNKVINEIDDLLLPYSFDISIFDHLSNPALIEDINRVGIIFFSRKKNMELSSQIGRGLWGL
jgi:predicted nucleotidyltransferase